MKVLHIISGLGDGGAEAVLFRLCQSDRSNEHVVFSLTNRGKYGDLLESVGATVHVVRISRGLSALRDLYALCRAVRACNPDVVQTWMYHADLLGGFAARFFSDAIVFWGVHNTALRLGSNRITTILISRINALMSRFIPSRIVYCADSSRRAHEEIGYKKGGALVVYNGYDLEMFKPEPSARIRHRRTFGFLDTDFVVGMVARFDPVKDHANLCAAVRLAIGRGVNVRVVMAGSGMTSKNEKLRQILKEHGLEENVLLLGPRTDVNTLMSSFDVCALSSLREAFPNVLAEAMACAVPCVSTRVGDASQIVADTGWITEPGDPEALANALESAYLSWTDRESWGKRKQVTRERIVQLFSLQRMVEAYIAAWAGTPVGKLRKLN